jgi:hypothetical protein
MGERRDWVGKWVSLAATRRGVRSVEFVELLDGWEHSGIVLNTASESTTSEQSELE